MLLATAAALLLAPARPAPAHVAPAHAAHAALDRLAGCWDAPGQVMGKRVATRVRGSWHLGARYLLLESHGLDPKDPYDAAIVIGDHGEHDATKLSGWWMDSFGAAYSALGQGKVENDVIAIDYAYPEAVYANRFVPEGKGWRWTITERKPDGSEKPFAAYVLTPVACGDTMFAF